MTAKTPKHWKIKTLGEIGKVKMCKRIFKDQTNKDSNDIPFYKIGTFGGNPDAFITKELYNEYKNKYPYPKKGDVLISAAGTIGRLVVFDGIPSYFQDSNIIWIENDENIALNKYLYHLYSNVKWKTTEGGIVSRLYNADVESLELPIPPLEEQEKIAEILLSCDKAIRLTTQIITQLKQRNQGLAQQLLTGEKRVKGFEKSVWKEVRLGEIGFFFKGKGVSKNKIIDKGFKCLTYGDLYTKYDFVIKDVKSFIDKETALISQEIRYGDICFAGSGETLEDIGKCATFIDDEIGYAGGDIIVFRTKQNPITMSYLLNSDIVKKQKTKMGQGHSVVHIYSSQLEKLEVSLPSLTEQNAIAQILDTAHQELKLYEQKLQLLQAQKKTLMQKLLTGEVLTIKK